MRGFNLPRSEMPVEVRDCPEQIQRTMRRWAKDWGDLDRAMAGFKRQVETYQRECDSIGREAQQILHRDKDLAREKQKALEEIMSRSTATRQALERLL